MMIDPNDEDFCDQCGQPIEECDCDDIEDDDEDEDEE